MPSNAFHVLGRALRRAGNELMRRNSINGVWIDVGAHRGETTLGYASHNPGLMIYAFEPNLRVATLLFGRANNYIVIPVAVSEADGYSEFHVNAFAAASSLLPMDENSRQSWTGGAQLQLQETVTVPTMRLDTFLNLAGIARVDFLKIDAQGSDLAVLRSAGSRLRDIVKVTVEVDISPRRLYVGSASREEVVAFLENAGFTLAAQENQSHGHEQNLTFQRVVA